MLKLDAKEYSKVFKALKEVRINNLFARAVVESFVSGEVYVDDLHSPETFYVVHPYGMSLLFGKHDNHEFNQAFKDHALNKNKTRDTHEWMQAYSPEWDMELKTLFSDCSILSSENWASQTSNIIELHTRVNFEFNIEKYTENRKQIKTTENIVIKTTPKEFKAMQGTVIPAKFWNNATDFIRNGIGFSMYAGGELACTAFASFLIDNFLELGMETVPKFRGKGFAQYTCSQLIDYCIENGYEPIWACSLANTGSFRLAEKLGFEPSVQIPYYRLSN